MADPQASTPKNTVEALVGQPQVASDDGGRGVGPTLGEDLSDRDMQADKAARHALDDQLRHTRGPPSDGQVRGGDGLARHDLASQIARVGVAPAPERGRGVAPTVATSADRDAAGNAEMDARKAQAAAQSSRAGRAAPEQTLSTDVNDVDQDSL